LILIQAKERSDGRIRALEERQRSVEREYEKEKAELWRHIRAGKYSYKSTATPGVGAPVASGTTADTWTTSSSASVAEARGMASGSAGGSTVNRRRPHVDAQGTTLRVLSLSLIDPLNKSHAFHILARL